MSRLLDQALSVGVVVQGTDITKLCFQTRRPDFSTFEVRDADHVLYSGSDWAAAKESYHHWSDLFNDEHPVYVKIWGI